MPVNMARRTTIASEALNCHLINESVTGIAFWAEKITATTKIRSAKKRIAIEPPFSPTEESL
jgi:hypothetical protein